MKIARSNQKPPAMKKILQLFWGTLLMRIILISSAVAIVFVMGAVAHKNGLFQFVKVMTSDIAEEVLETIDGEVALYADNGLPTLYIDMPFESSQRIEEKRTEALRIGMLLTSDDDYVPAQVRYRDGEILDVRMRLKGDWMDHLEGEKWSFRIHVRGDGQVMGMRRFSIQAPETRMFLNEWAFHENLIREGMLTTRYEFVNVLLNGELKGIYALEESFAEELLESQGRRPGVIIRFDEDLMWRNGASLWQAGVHSEGRFMVTNENSADVTLFRSNYIAEDPELSLQAETAIGLLKAFQTGQRKASEVFDVSLIGRYYALTDLWEAEHSNDWNNRRFFYNPITGLLEPIAFDAEPLRGIGYETSVLDFVNDRVFDDPLIRKAYAQELDRISQPEYLTSFRDEINAELETLQAALKSEYIDVELSLPWELLEYRSIMLQTQLKPVQAVRGAYQVVRSEDNPHSEQYLQVDLINQMILPVVLVRFQIGNENIVPDVDWINPVTGDVLMSDQSLPVLFPVQDPNIPGLFDPVRFLIPFGDFINEAESESDAMEVDLIVRLAGLTEEFRIPLREEALPQALLNGPTPGIPDLSSMLEQHPFLSSQDNGRTLIVESGDWNVHGDLVIPEGIKLMITPGTTLRFESDALLYSTTPVMILGTEMAPVLLTAQKDTWAGVAVLHAEEDSIWKYALIEKMGGIAREGWMLTGGITFYESPLSLDHVRILHSQGEDAINVVRSKFSFLDSEFGYAVSDAFDGDFSTGTIIGCSFHDIGGDAIDISGADLIVEATSIVNVADKGVSVGEQSIATLYDVQIYTVGVGVASKDLSSISIDQVDISGAVNAGLAAYIKKPVYGPAHIKALSLT